MKKILSLIVITILLLSCNRVEPIHSLSQLEPALRKHVGNPSKIDTVYKGDILLFSGINYSYDSVPEVKFENLVEFLSEAYNAKPIITIDLPRRRAEFIPLKDHPGAFYRIQVNDYWNGEVKERQLGFLVIDINNELATPSSPTPQTVVPSR